MFELEGEQYSLEQVTSAAEQSNMSLDDYLNKYSIKNLEEAVETVEKLDGAAIKDADVVPVATPTRASIISGVQPEVTESPSVDTSSELQDPEPILLDEVVIKANKNTKRSAEEINNIFGSSVWGDTRNASDLNILNTNVKNYANLKQGTTIEDVLEMGTADTVTQGMQKKNRTSDQNNWTNKNKILSNLTSLFDNYQGVPVSELQSLGGDIYALDFENEVSQDYLNKRIKQLQFQIENSASGDTSDQKKELEELKEQLDDSFNGGGNFKTINIKEARDYRLQAVKNNKLEEFINKGLDQEAMMPRIKSTGYKRLSSNGKKIADLIDKYGTANAEDKKEISKQIDILQSKIDEGDALYDLNTGKLIDIKNASPSQIESNNKSKTLAQTNSPKEIEKMLFDSNLELVALASEINDVFNTSKTEFVATGVEDTFDGKKKQIIEYITTTGKLPEGVTKLKGDDPLTKAFNKSLENYDVINKALLTNTNPLKTEWKEYWNEFVDGAANVVGSDITTRAESQKLFGKSLKAYGFDEEDVNALMKETKTNVAQDIMKGLPHLAAFVGKVGATKKLTGNGIGRAAVWGEKTLNAFFKGNKYVKAGIKPVFKGITESLEFGSTAALSNVIFGEDESVSESMLAGGAFGFGGTVANGFVKALNKGFARQVAKNPLYYLDKSKVYKDFVKKSTESAGGATSFIAGTALLEGEEFDYSFNKVGRTFLTEWGKMYLLGALRRTINSPAGNVNSIYNRFSEDIYRMQRLSVGSVAGGKKLGISKEEIKRPKTDTNDKVEKSYNNAVEQVDEKLFKTEITKEQADQEKKELKNNKLAVENQIGINQAKDLLKQEELNGNMPTPGEKYVAIQKLKNGEDLKEKDSRTLSNMGPELVLRDLGVEGNSTNLDLSKQLIDREVKIQAILNGGQSAVSTSQGLVYINEGQYKAIEPKLRKETYDFLNKKLTLDADVQKLQNTSTSKMSPVQKKTFQDNLKVKETELEEYMEGGKIYEDLQIKLTKQATKEYEANISSSKQREGVSSRGVLKEIESAEKFQEKYNELGLQEYDGVKEEIAFVDPNTGDRYINREKALEVRNTSPATHEEFHAVTQSALLGADGKVTKEGIVIVDKILESLSPKQRQELDKEVSTRYDTKKPKEEWYDENLTILSDLIYKKVIKFNDGIGEGLKNLLPVLQKKFFKNLKVDSVTGEGMFEMLKGLSKGSKGVGEAAGRFSKQVKGPSTSTTIAPFSKRSIELKEQLEDLKDREFELEQGDFDSQKSNLELKIRQAEKSEARDESESIKTTAVEKIKPVKKLGIIDEIVEKATAQKLEAPIVSDKNKKIASINEDIVKEMTALGANRISEIEDKEVRQSIVDRLGANNVGAIKELAKKAAFKGKDLAIDEELKVGYDEFIGGFSAELSALINSYKANVNGKKVPFGAYMNQNLPLRYPAILRKSLEGKLKKSESLSSDKNIKKQVASIESDSNDFELGGKDDSSEELIVDQIDVRKFGPARDKVDEISKIVEVEKGERPSYKDLANKYLDQVSMELFNVPGKKIKGGATLKDSEAKSLQALFINPNNVRKLFKTMPPYNVAGSQTTIGEQAESIDVSKDVKGKSIGLSNKFMIKFYQPVTRAIPGISSPKGRSLGLTSQGQVYELKPEFRGRITNDAIKDIQRSVGVTEKGVPSEKISDANRSKYGTTLTGFAKAYVANVINITGRSKQTDKQEQADTGAGKARVMFSKGSDINKNLKNKNDNYKRFRNSILNKDMFHGGSKTTSTEATWFYLDNPEAAKMWGDGKVYKTNSSLLKDQLIIPDLNDVSEYHKHASKKFGLPEENFFDVRNIMKLSNAGEIINDWIDWVAKNKTDWDLGYNLYEQGSLTEGIAVTVIGKIPESKLETFKEDTGAGKARIMLSATVKKNKGFSDKFKSKEVKKLIDNKFKNLIKESKLPETVAQEIKNVIENEKLNPVDMFQVVSDIASRDLNASAKRSFQEGLITDLIKAEGKDFGAVLVENLGKIRKIFKKEYEAIGFVMEVESLKESIKGENKETRDAKVIDWLLSVSRSVRSSKNKSLLYVSTNKKLFDSVLKDVLGKDSDFEAVQKKLPSGKVVSFIKYKGEGLEGFQDITELKSKGFGVYGEKVSEQADKARELALDKLDSLKDRLDKKEITKGQYDSMVDSYLSLISLDQKGIIRKMSKPNSEIIDGYRPTELYLEHKMAAQEIKELLSSYAEGEVEKQEVLDILEKEALVNIMPKALEKFLPNFAAERAKDPNYKNSKGYESKEYLKALEQYKPFIKDMYGNTARFSKTQKEEKAKSLDKEFNDIIENKTGIPSRKRYGIVEATTKGASKGKFNFFIPPSAEDFVGLLYPTLGKGEVGDSQMKWYKDNLITPYAKAMNKLSQARVYILNNYKSLKNQLGVVPKDLSKKVEGTDYTKEMAVRVYIWNKQKMNVPGISESDVRKLSKFVTENENLQTFGDQLINLQLGDGYIKPKEGWAAGTITTDILEGLNTTKRSKYLKEWQENADVIFSEDNMNKLQAVYGLNYVKAMKNMLGRMKSGRNRNFPGDSATGRFTDWVTGSVGVTMFLNTRSAVLQTISAINFINFTDNNILAAGKAFANQPQYWKDFMMLMNSDFLKERRGGLRINVSEADIADMAKKGGVRGAISKLLELGFAPTQIADSFAIASGGSTFYRNRVNTYKKQGLTEKQAEKKAFEDFRETAEESQQSSRADRISMQQASPVGRFVLAFANTPAQYARIIKKAASDLKNGRGDRRTNISKIIYYGAAQNLLFNALQQALFATALDDEEPKDKEKEKKYLNIANGMMDSLLRGTGIGGSVVSVGKNAIVKLVRELEKDRPKIQNVAAELLKISPPVSAKYSRLVQAGKSYDWNKDEMMEKGLSLDNPAYLAGSQVVSALTNIPLDRAIKKANNVVQATSQDLETWERIGLLGGWQDWELGIDKEDKKPKIKTRSTKKVRKKIIKKKLETKFIE